MRSTTQFESAQAEAGVDVFYAWGLNDVDRSGVNVLLDVDYLGEPRFEEGFSFSPRCQAALRKICADLRLYNASDEYLRLIKRNAKSEGSIKCFVEDLASEASRNNWTRPDRYALQSLLQLTHLPCCHDAHNNWTNHCTTPALLS